MTNRSANAPITGYFYQFDHTIVQLLSAGNGNATVCVEGIEDIDLVDGDDAVLIQCKYYEGTEYNHSLIKDAIIQMLLHFHSTGCNPSQTLKYRIYGHYKSGQEKLPSSINLVFLKRHFLSYLKNGTNHEKHVELKLTDASLENFLGLLEINVQAKTYNAQQSEVARLLVSQIPDCTQDDAQIFYYPLAIDTIRKLAIQTNDDARRITKGEFLNAVKKKEVVFGCWLRQKFGNDYYARSIKKTYFKFPSTKVPKASRIFIIDVGSEFDVAKTAALLDKIGTKYSHVEHTRTPAKDRFCPYILLHGVSPVELISLKEHLLNSGTKLVDGHAFNGSTFSPSYLVADPTKENLIKLKFIPSAEQVGAVIALISGMSVEIFEFFKDNPIAVTQVGSCVLHHKIKVDTVYLINEVM